ncbi:unnamed protein product, partial [Musa acuminata subsp. burmannicoides]
MVSISHKGEFFTLHQEKSSTNEEGERRRSPEEAKAGLLPCRKQWSDSTLYC